MKIFDIFKRTRSEKSQRVMAKLEEVENEMKKIGFWIPNPPAFKAHNYLEAPSFELWLQCVFIPNARKAAEEEAYPKDSQVGQMAMRQYDYHSFVKETQALLQLLNEFDSIIRTK